MERNYMLIFNGKSHMAELIVRTLLKVSDPNWYHVEAEIAAKKLNSIGKEFWNKNSVEIINPNRKEVIGNSLLSGKLYNGITDFEVAGWLDESIRIYGSVNFFKFRRKVWIKTGRKIWLDLELGLKGDNLIGMVRDLDKSMNPVVVK